MSLLGTPALLSAISLLVAASGCSLLTTDRAECASNRDCSNAFGAGSVCRDDGFCAQAEIHPRCTKTYPEDLLATPEKRLIYKDYIVFGSVFDRNVGLFILLEKSAQLALQQINAFASSEDDIRVGMVFCDARVENSNFNDAFLSTEEAVAGMTVYLADEFGVPAIFGSAKSSESNAGFQAIQDRQVLMISPSSTSPALSSLDVPNPNDASPGFFWRTAPSDAFQTKAMAFDMRTPGAGRSAPVTDVAVVHVDDAYGNGIYESFLTEFKALGGGEVIRIPFNAGSLGDAVAQAGMLDVDEIIFASSNVADIVGFFDAATNQSAYVGKPLFLTEASATNDVLKGTQNTTLFSNVRATRPKPLDAELDIIYNSFLSSYRTTYDDTVDDIENQVFTANAFDAAWLMAYSAAWALLREGELSGLNMARGMRQLSNPQGALVEIGRQGGWELIQQQFRAGAAVDVNGASGPLDYDQATEETATNIEIWTITGAQEIQPVYTWTLDGVAE